MVLFLGLLTAIGFNAIGKVWAATTSNSIPSLAQVINQKSFNVLETVPPPDQANATSVGDFKPIHDSIECG